MPVSARLCLIHLWGAKSADFALNPVTIINQSHEYDPLLNPVDPSGESSNKRVVLKAPDTL